MSNVNIEFYNKLKTDNLLKVKAEYPVTQTYSETGFYIKRKVSGTPTFECRSLGARKVIEPTHPATVTTTAEYTRVGVGTKTITDIVEFGYSFTDRSKIQPTDCVYNNFAYWGDEINFKTGKVTHTYDVSNLTLDTTQITWSAGGHFRVAGQTNANRIYFCSHFLVTRNALPADGTCRGSGNYLYFRYDALETGTEADNVAAFIAWYNNLATPMTVAVKRTSAEITETDIPADVMALFADIDTADDITISSSINNIWSLYDTVSDAIDTKISAHNADEETHTKAFGAHEDNDRAHIKYFAPAITNNREGCYLDISDGIITASGGRSSIAKDGVYGKSAKAIVSGAPKLIDYTDSISSIEKKGNMFPTDFNSTYFQWSTTTKDVTCNGTVPVGSYYKNSVGYDYNVSPNRTINIGYEYLSGTHTGDVSIYVEVWNTISTRAYAVGPITTMSVPITDNESKCITITPQASGAFLHIGFSVTSEAVMSELKIKPFVSPQGTAWVAPKTSIITSGTVLRGLKTNSANYTTYTEGNQRWYADYGDVDSELLTKRVGRVEFDGSNDETWECYYDETAAKYYVCIAVEDLANIPVEAMSSHYNYGVSTDNSCWNTDKIYFMDSTVLNGTTTADNLAKWKTYIASNIQSVCYPATETTSSYGGIHTFSYTGSLFVSCGCVAKVSYLADTKAYMDSWGSGHAPIESRIAALEAALGGLSLSIDTDNNLVVTKNE